MPGRVLALVLALLAWALPAAADGLMLPPDRRQAILRTIDDACPECRRTGFVLCGGPRVGSGPAFAAGALQGSPRRGYLVGFTMSGAEFRNIVRGTQMTPLLAGLERRFARARLIVLEDGFARVRVLDQSPLVAVAVPPPLHACVADPGKPWGCCAGPGCVAECCEKRLGSPAIRLDWVDAETREAVRFEFSHASGQSRLVRQAGNRRTTYSCATDRRYGLD